ncbi:MAG: hypothetical protein ACK5Y2_03185 [Bdellovibrionales bacterium]
MKLKWTWAPQAALILLSIFLSRLGTAAVLEPGLEAAVPFYKTPESPFPSGQINKTSLLQNQQGSFTDFHFKALWGAKKIQVKNDQILRELDVALRARARRPTVLRLLPEMGSTVLLELGPGQVVDVESQRGAWARVKASSLQKGYVLLTELENTEDDPGVWMGLREVFLRKEPSASSATVVKIPALTRLQLVRIEGEYGFFKTSSKFGYVALKDLVGRSDLAQWAWSPKLKRWQAVLYRNGAELVMAGNTRLSLQEISALRGAKNRALIVGEHSVAGRGARVDLIEPVAVKWTQSLLKGHGPIWWKIDLLEKKHESQVLANSELMRRNLKGLSFDSKTKRGLASAGGIYRTVDGKKWTKISMFGQENWPVSLHPSGVWFVGPYRSTDDGETFKPSIRWSDLVETLQGSRNKAFTHLRVLDIENTSMTHVTLKVDTGITVLKIKAPVLGHQWMVVENSKSESKTVSGL